MITLILMNKRNGICVKLKLENFVFSKVKKRSQRSGYLKLQEDLDKADAGIAAEPQNSELLKHRERVKMKWKFMRYKRLREQQHVHGLSSLRKGKKTQDIF